MTDSLFVHSITAPDPTYNAIRDNQTPDEQQTRLFLEEMWQKYKPYADRDFKKQIQYDFDSRFWEMYLACALIDNAIPLSVKRGKTNRGPDILVDPPNGHIWIEAIAPTAGDEVNPDHVPDIPPGFLFTQPKDKILLRYRGAIEYKHDKYQKYKEDGIISPTDSYVIAINSCKIPSAIDDSDWTQKPPYILEVVFPIERVWIISDLEGAREGFRFRNEINRVSGAKVDTTVFLDSRYVGISGVICANVSSGHFPLKMGGNFIFIHNPLASNPIPNGFLKVGREYRASQKENGYVLTATDWA